VSTSPDITRVRADVAEILGDGGSEGIAPDDNLLDVGIDSVRLMMLTQRWQDDGIDVDFASLVEEPTLARWEELFAAAPRRARAAGGSSLSTLSVVRVEQLTPRVVRITLGGKGIEAFDGAAPGAHALLRVPGGAAPRPVTVRYHGGSAEIDLDVVTHERGPLGRWASAVRPPETVTVSRPVTPPAPDAGADWTLHVTDQTGFAAVAHRLERLPADARAVVVAVVADAAEEQLFPAVAALDVRWVHAAPGTGAELAVAAARAALPDSGVGAVRVTGEAELVRAVTAAVGDSVGQCTAEPYWQRSVDAEELFRAS